MREIKYRHFIRDLIRNGAKRRIPRRAMFELTYRCNFKCVHCYIPEEDRIKNRRTEKLKNLRTEELSAKEVFSILDELADFGILNIGFTGGEIFLRDDLFDILIYARRKGFRVSLLTNGFLITEKIVDKLIKYRIKRFEISFLGATPEVFDRITQISGSYEKVLANIKMLKAKGASVLMKSCVMDINLEEVVKIRELANSLGIRFNYSHLLQAGLDCGKEPTYHRLPPEEFIMVRRKIQDTRYKIQDTNQKPKTKNRLPLTKNRREKLFNCLAGYSMLFINPYGELQACMGLPFPNYDLRKGNLKEGWDAVKTFVDNAKPPENWKCKTCELWDFCPWCPAGAYFETGEMTGCPEYFKEIARLRKQKTKNRTKEQKN